MNPPPLRLAVLEADVLAPEIFAAHGGNYTAIFTHLLRRAAAPKPLEDEVTLTGHNIVGARMHSYPALENVDALLISGSKHDAFANDAWVLALVEYTRSAVATGRVRVVGVCFGHQIVARALGVPVGRAERGWEVSVTEMSLTEEGRQVFGRDKLSIHQMHRDQVFAVPAGAQLLAETGTCPVQAFVIPGRVMTVQGHPEYNQDMMRRILDMRHESGLFTHDLYKSGLERVCMDQDGVHIAKVFLKFLRQIPERSDSSDSSNTSGHVHD